MTGGNIEPDDSLLLSDDEIDRFVADNPELCQQVSVQLDAFHRQMELLLQESETEGQSQGSE